MVGGAYLFLPITGLIAYFAGHTRRARFHGLQAIVYGFVWGALLIACSAITPGASQAAFGVGGLVWLGLLLGTAAGKDPRLPGIGRLLERAALEPPDEDDGSAESSS